MMRALACVATLLAASLVGWAAPANADGCSTQVGILGANAACAWTYAEYSQTSSSDITHTWVVTIQCGNGGICADHVECNENGEAGFVHDVYMDGMDVGDVCVPEAEIDQVNITQLILREFKRIAWPASHLVVQPPHGKTLVNFATNFYTPDHQAIPQHLTVAKKRVTIEAFPTSYEFHFGDGATTQTSSPGSPYPSLDVTHTYGSLGKVAVSVDTTYSGRYKIGDGDWVAIAETLTVDGADQGLEVVEAIPQLVLQ